MNGRPWTKAEDAAVRRAYAREGPGPVARRLGRTYPSVQARAKRLGLASRAFWSPADLAALRDGYGTVPTAELARTVGRSPGAVHQAAAKLRLVLQPRIPDRVAERVRALHAAGLPDTPIARRLRMPVRTVCYVRGRLGLPMIRDHDAKLRAVRTQFARLGVKNAGELRALSFRRYARENGWPEGLRPREVQILNVLCERGPRTQAQLAAAIGMRTDLRNAGHGAPCYLKANGPGGTYTAALLRRGLVIRRHRSVKGRGKGGRLPDLYLATPQAIALREETLERQRHDERGDARGAGPRPAAPIPQPGRRTGSWSPAGRTDPSAWPTPGN